MTAEKALYNLIAIALGNEEASRFLMQDCGFSDWNAVLKLAEKHAVQGVAFEGYRLLVEQGKGSSTWFKPLPTEAMLGWYAQAMQIKKRNEEMNRACCELTRKFSDVGLETVVMKGQSMARLYPNPMARVSGDIDVFTVPSESSQVHKVEKQIGEIVRAVDLLGEKKVGHVVYHHSEWRMGDVSVEIHHRPMYLNNPIWNRRFQKWSSSSLKVHQVHKVEGVGEFHSPSLEFDLVYILLHVYHHLLFEGVGLRQIMDYAVVLKQLESCKVCKGYKVYEEIRQSTVDQFSRLGMMKFARGLMWVLRETCGAKDEELLLEADERVGRFILNEVMTGGNMGQHDERVKRVKGVVKHRSLHRLRFIRMFPQEILWDVPFRVWHKCWRAVGQLKYGWS